MEIAKLTIKQASKLLQEKKLTCQELTKAVLANIDQKEQEINAFITLEGDLALLQAQKCDERLSKGQRLSEIDGVPLAIKDNILMKGLPCTAGSKILENFIAPYDATVIKKLKNAGVVFVGKTNMDEFAMGSSTETSYFGPTRNPFDLERVPGGSSGGSAAAVAADMCLGALGADTGGSIRQPASFCGVVGFKPTYGSVSRYGLIAMASSLDQIGPITKTVEDAKMLFNSIKGEDRFDSTSVKVSNRKIKEIKNLKTMKIGFIDTQPTDKSQKIYNKTIEKLKKYFKKVEITSQLKDVLNLALACYYIIMFAEVSSNLARYDGIKYGYSKLKTNFEPSESAAKAENEKLKTDGIIVATTRPETMLGDTAVAVNPTDKRYENFIGKMLVLPLLGREIPVIADKAVDKKFGTGAVKVTPAHDPKDFEIGQHHKLPAIKVIDELGKMTKEADKYAGQKTQQARENILQDLQQKGLLLKTQKYVHQVPHCYRCGKIVEQLVSKQWFVKMQQLAQPAIEAVKNGKIKFEPKRWEKVYLDWMKNLKDWCISRQIWWGHRLPVWTQEEIGRAHV